MQGGDLGDLADGEFAPLRPRVATLVVPRIGWFRVGYTACFHRCHLRDQKDQPDLSRVKSVTGMPVVGMVGGGQLARMTAAAAVGLGATFRVLAESADESAALVTHDVAIGSHLSLPDIAAFAAECDVITFDHEHVPGPILAELESAGVLVRPGSAALGYTQDKLAMRERLSSLGVPCPRFAPVASVADVEKFAAGSWPVVLKAVSGGYDGKGVWVCDSAGRGGGGRLARHQRCSPRSSCRSSGSWRRSSPCHRPVRAPPTRWCRPSRWTASAGR